MRICRPVRVRNELDARGVVQYH